jgi:hypothetical protein
MLHHTGGMMLFTSSFDVDAEAGVGAFASTNGTLGEHRPTLVTAFAARALRAVREGKILPAQPDPYASRRIAKPDHYVGRWVAADGTALEIGRSGTGLAVRSGTQTGKLELVDGEVTTDLPGFRAASLEFSRDDGDDKAKDKNAPPTRLWYRDIAFSRERAPDKPLWHRRISCRWPANIVRPTPGPAVPTSSCGRTS